MDPVTLAIAGVAAAGKIFEGFAAGAALEDQAEIARENAAMLGRQAEIEELGVDIALAKGALAQLRVREKVTAILAAQPGHYAAAGLAVTSVSPLVVAAHTAAQGQADIEIAQANTALEAANAQVRVANTRTAALAQAQSAAALEDRAFTARVAGVLGAGTAFLSAGKDSFVGLGAEPAPGFYGGSPATNPLLRPV